jgi:glycosyltransferase involved in cell wall biosynthesis
MRQSQVIIKPFLKSQFLNIQRRFHRHIYRHRPFRVGWVTANTLMGDTPEQLGHLGSVPDMRISNTGHWINKNTQNFWNEIYDPTQHYNIVIFVKAMDAVCQAEVQKIQSYGGKVIFDANVNYYEIWGTYDVEGTQPTQEQQSDAIWMTQHANWVIADSTYLLNIVQNYNSNASWIPDNVELKTFNGTRQHENKYPVRLVWSGVAKKAQPLLLLYHVLALLENVELVLVSETQPEVIPKLKQALPCHFVPYNNRRYARTLQTCDIIISPKNLINGYEMGHTEYKITLGMACGLPAVASPQQSYQEAINHKGGGIIADTPEEWQAALQKLCSSSELRIQMGLAAQQTVKEQYATPVVAHQYLEVLQELI